MSVIKENLTGILVCIVEGLIGVLLLVNPEGFASLIVLILGIALAAYGLIYILKYFMQSPVEAALSQNLSKGLMSAGIGALCLIKPSWLIMTFPLITFFYGIAFLASGFWKIQLTVDMLRAKIKRWYIPAISTVLTVASAVIILTHPYMSTLFLWEFAGITLIAAAAVDAAWILATGAQRTVRI